MKEKILTCKMIDQDVWVDLLINNSFMYVTYFLFVVDIVSGQLDGFAISPIPTLIYGQSTTVSIAITSLPPSQVILSLQLSYTGVTISPTTLTWDSTSQLTQTFQVITSTSSCVSSGCEFNPTLQIEITKSGADSSAYQQPTNPTIQIRQLSKRREHNTIFIL